MANTTLKHKQKKSQKRKDRQARRAERQQEKAKKSKKDTIAKIKFSKKSLPGFLAKNAKTICQWLRDYSLLFMMADDYGLQRLERMPSERRAQLVQNYVDVNEFITIVEEMLQANDAKNSEIENSTQNTKLEEEKMIGQEELDEIADLPDDDIEINNDIIEEENPQKPAYTFEDMQQFVENLKDYE